LIGVLRPMSSKGLSFEAMYAERIFLVSSGRDVPDVVVGIYEIYVGRTKCYVTV